MKPARSVVITTLAAVVMALAAPAAASNYLACDGCSISQMRQLALKQGMGRYVVGSVTNRTLQAFEVLPTSRADSALQARKGEIYPPERTAFTALVQFYNMPPVGYHKHFTVHYPGVAPSPAQAAHANNRLTSDTVAYANRAINAYDVIDGGPAQNALLQSLNHTGVFKSYGKPPFVEVFPNAVRVAFADGSSIGVRVNKTEHPAQLQVSAGSARDSHLNTIPDSPAAVAGIGITEYSFASAGNPTDQARMRRRIQRFGIAVPTAASYQCLAPTGQPGHLKTRCQPSPAQSLGSL